LLISGARLGDIPLGGGLEISIDFKGMMGGIASSGYSNVFNQLKQLPGLVFQAQKVMGIVPVGGKSGHIKGF
jgi:hypothetical protein